MKRYVCTLATMAAAVVAVLSSAARAGTTATKQLAITIRPATETFQLSWFSAGSVVRDAGSGTWGTVEDAL